MVYIKETGNTALTDEQGKYNIRISGNYEDSVSLEYSFIGYKSQEIRLLPEKKKDTTEIAPVFLLPQPIMISAAYILPKGKTAAEYIISQVWKRADENEKKLKNYGAEVTYNLSSHEAPTIAKIIPSAMLAIAKGWATISGFGPTARLCLKNDDVNITATLNRHVINGKTIDTDNRIISSNIELDKKTEENFKEIFSHFDLFDLLYGYHGSWRRRFTKHETFELVGTYEYGDKLVDVLEWKSEGRLTAKAHIIEDDWGILKIQINYGPEAIRCEARDIGNGIFMPVSLVISPSATLIPAEKIPRAIAVVNNMRTINKKTKKRITDILKSRIGQDFNPFMTFGYNIRYDKINPTPQY